MIGYEIQGRRTERGTDGRVVRDRVRLASADNRDAAFEIANTMAADDYKTWIFQTEQSSGKKTYVLFGVLP